MAKLAMSMIQHSTNELEDWMFVKMQESNARKDYNRHYCHHCNHILETTDDAIRHGQHYYHVDCYADILND